MMDGTGGRSFGSRSATVVAGSGIGVNEDFPGEISQHPEESDDQQPLRRIQNPHLVNAIHRKHRKSSEHRPSDDPTGNLFTTRPNSSWNPANNSCGTGKPKHERSTGEVRVMEVHARDDDGQ